MNYLPVLIVIYVGVSAVVLVRKFHEQTIYKNVILPLRQRTRESAKTPTFVCYGILDRLGIEDGEPMQLLGDQCIGTLKPGMRLNAHGVTVTVTTVYGDENKPESPAPAAPGTVDNVVVIDGDDDIKRSIIEWLQTEHIIAFEVWD